MAVAIRPFFFSANYKCNSNPIKNAKVPIAFIKANSPGPWRMIDRAYLTSMNPTVAQFYQPSILKDACTRFGVKPEAATLIRDNSNLIRDCGDKILRLTHSVVRPSKEVDVEIAWLLDLSQRQLPVTRVLPSVNGHYV